MGAFRFRSECPICAGGLTGGFHLSFAHGCPNTRSHGLFAESGNQSLRYEQQIDRIQDADDHHIR